MAASERGKAGIPRTPAGPDGVHLVAFDIPWPANYGGVMVVYHRLRALHAAGVRVKLHCFQYGGRTPQPELEQYCTEVHYYARLRSWMHQLSAEPFIIRTRRAPELLRRLCADTWPILFEGLHTTAFIGHPALAGRTKIVLMHNVEWQYYAALARSTSNPLKKLYFLLESSKLRRAERLVARHADALVALTGADAAYFQRFGVRTVYIPAFHGHGSVQGQPGHGRYVLFHGKLSVPDNARAAEWLVEQVAARRPQVPFIVAGLDPPPALQRLAARYANVRLIAGPDDQEMQGLIRAAHVHALVTFQSAGIKLKLLHALFRGRFCLVNAAMVAGTDLADLCVVHDSPEAFAAALDELMSRTFDATELARRKGLLEGTYSDQRNAARLMEVVRSSGVATPIDTGARPPKGQL